MGDLVVGSPAPPSPPAAPESVKARLGRAALLLAVASALALACSAVVLAFVLRADFLDGAALLVGYGYMQRAVRRRAAEKAAAAGAAAVQAPRP